MMLRRSLNASFSPGPILLSVTFLCSFPSMTVTSSCLPICFLACSYHGGSDERFLPMAVTKSPRVTGLYETCFLAISSACSLAIPPFVSSIIFFSMPMNACLHGMVEASSTMAFMSAEA